MCHAGVSRSDVTLRCHAGVAAAFGRTDALQTQASYLLRPKAADKFKNEVIQVTTDRPTDPQNVSRFVSRSRDINEVGVIEIKVAQTRGITQTECEMHVCEVSSVC